jgi:hypothetical protein
MFAPRYCSIAMGPDTYLVGSRREEVDEMDGSKTRLDDLGESTARRHSRGEECQGGEGQ